MVKSVYLLFVRSIFLYNPKNKLIISLFGTTTLMRESKVIALRRSSRKKNSDSFFSVPTITAMTYTNALCVTLIKKFFSFFFLCNIRAPYIFYSSTFVSFVEELPAGTSALFTGYILSISY